MQGELFPFGKYKGKPIAEVLQNRSYCDWLLAQPFFKNKFSSFYQIIINYQGEPDNTPEHNALQARFLDERFCLALGKLCGWKLMNKKACLRNLGAIISATKNINTRNAYEYDKQREKLDELIETKEYLNEAIIEWEGKEIMDGEPFFKIKTIMEDGDWDVIVQTDNSNCKQNCPACKECDISTRKIAIEVKPTVGDDYPVILRKMKNARFHPQYQCLVYDKFSADGASLDEVKKMFESSDFFVFSFLDIEKAHSGLPEN